MLYTQNIKIYLQSSATIQKAKVAKFQSVASTHQTWAPATPFAPKAITSIAKSEKPRQNGGRSSNLKHLYTTLNVYILLQSRKSHFSVFYSSFLILYIFPYQSLFCISSFLSLTRTYSLSQTLETQIPTEACPVICLPLVISHTTYTHTKMNTSKTNTNTYSYVQLLAIE